MPRQFFKTRYILSSIYIKSQPVEKFDVYETRYILSSIYIKSQPRPVKALKFKTFHEIQARKNADFCFLGTDLMSFSDFNISKNKCIKKVPIV